MSKFYCLIPARGGSKGIPRKNIKILNGIPLIAHSILCAKKSKVFEEVYVSTDDIEILRFLYSAADVMLIPSVQDNLPNTVLEALTIGVPCVSFDVGGFPDLIFDPEMGYTVEPFEILDFSKKVISMLEKKTNSDKIRNLAIQKFGEKVVACHHLNLYKKLIW